MRNILRVVRTNETNDSAAKERQQNFLQKFSAKMGVRQGLWLNKDHWNYWKYEDKNLMMAQDLNQRSMGRKRLTPENSDAIVELWTDLDNHEGKYSFSTFKGKLVKPQYRRLLDLGIPSESINLKATGRGIHFQIYISGLPNNFNIQELFVKAVTVDADHCSRKLNSRIREWGARTSDNQGFVSAIQYSDLEKARVMPKFKENEVVYPDIVVFQATEQFKIKLALLDMDVRYQHVERNLNEITDFNRDGNCKQMYKCPVLERIATANSSQEARHRLSHNERFFFMLNFIHFGNEGRAEIHRVISLCPDYSERYTEAMIQHAMKHQYLPITCSWAKQMRLCCETDCYLKKTYPNAKSAIKLAWSPLSLDEIKAEYRKILLLAPEDDDIIEVVLSQILDVHIGGDLAWLFVVAPPSWAKTVILVSIDDPEWSKLIETVTNKTFITGKTRVNPETGRDVPIEGLLPKLHMKTFICKEFTGQLMMGEEIRNDVFGQLRGIYDRKFTPAVGSYDFDDFPEEWKNVKMGFLAGCTPYIDKYDTLNAMLGERFLKIRMTAPDRIAANRYSRLGAQDKEKKTTQLQRRVKRFIANKLETLPKQFEQPPDCIGNALDYLGRTSISNLYTIIQYSVL